MAREKQEVHVSVTPALLVNTGPPSPPKRLEVTGPFNVYKINPSKSLEESKVRWPSQTAFIVPPITIHPKNTKKETADTALSMTETTLKDSRSAYIRSIINFIDTVLKETAGTPASSKLF